MPCQCHKHMSETVGADELISIRPVPLALNLHCLGRHGSKEKEEDCDNSSYSRVRETTFVCIHDVSNCHICSDSMVL
ncbi:unnamed protein product [Prunus armeniaca]